MLKSQFSRRQFGQFLGAGALLAASHRLAPNWCVSQAADAPVARTPLIDGFDFKAVAVSHGDDVILPEGYEYEVILGLGAQINPQGEKYGDDNDYLAWVKTDRQSGWLWSNHENASLTNINGKKTELRTREQAALLLSNMGGSCLRMRRIAQGGKMPKWRPILPHRESFRVNGLDTRIALTGPARGSDYVLGATHVMGSLANCGGGISPWGTFFTAEENFQNTYGDAEMGDKPGKIGSFFPRPSQHYGYMVEIDPHTRRVYKHSHLGRFAHENVAFTLARDGRLVCYLGDDRVGQCIYKFISAGKYVARAGARNRELLSKGTLYVADTERGRWLPLDPKQQPKLQEHGFDMARVCVHTRTAASLVGGTPHARPEDVEVHPETGEVFVCLTSYEPGKPPEGEAYTSGARGALGRIREAGNDAGALEHEFDIFVAGGQKSGLVWPDNIAFTEQSNLLVTTDYSTGGQPKPNTVQGDFGNNYIALVSMAGANRGQVQRFAVGPRGAEFCAPTLSPDRDELWVNVQHPSHDSSHWPDGGDASARSSMIAIRRVS